MRRRYALTRCCWQAKKELSPSTLGPALYRFRLVIKYKLIFQRKKGQVGTVGTFDTWASRCSILRSRNFKSAKSEGTHCSEISRLAQGSWMRQGTLLYVAEENSKARSCTCKTYSTCKAGCAPRGSQRHHNEYGGACGLGESACYCWKGGGIHICMNPWHTNERGYQGRVGWRYLFQQTWHQLWILPDTIRRTVVQNMYFQYTVWLLQVPETTVWHEVCITDISKGNQSSTGQTVWPKSIHRLCIGPRHYKGRTWPPFKGSA